MMTNVKFKNLEILDCTIRDGGYLNNWNFDRKVVKELYRNLSRAGVDIIEIGYRNTPKGNEGEWFTTPEDLINKLLGEISGAKIALMVDYREAVLSSIPDQEKSLVKMYRIACQKDQILDAIVLGEDIKKKGYLTSIQLMGIVDYTQDDFEMITDPLAKSTLDYVYFADSYGSLFPEDMCGYIKKLKSTGKKIGFHSHNGLQLAFANTLESIKCGADIVDGTVYGMGRGAGNLPIEVLITYLEKALNHERYNSIPILDLIDRYFLPLQKDISWGYCLPYMLSGIFEVHPNYAKHIIDCHEYNMDDMVKVLEVVKSQKPLGFNRSLIDKIISSGFEKPSDQEEALMHDDLELQNLKKNYPVKYKDRHKGKDFLVLANGHTLKKYRNDIGRFIDGYGPIVLGANYLGDLFVPHYHAFSNKKRFINYVDQVGDQSKLLLSSSFDEEFIAGYTKRNYETIVHLNRVSNQFGIEDDIITSNCRTVSALLIAVAVIMGAKRIFIAGMDGYKDRENFISRGTHFYEESEEAENLRMLMEKHSWNEKLLNGINSFLKAQDKEGLHIITPTSHKYFYSSINNWVNKGRYGQRNKIRIGSVL